MKILFISHKPHYTLLKYAQELKAQIKIIPFIKYTNLIKKIKFTGLFYPLISLFYSLKILIKDEEILLVDGGSSLYTSAFLKRRYPNIKLIYLNCDLFFYELKNLHKLKKWAISKIDAIISDSLQNKAKISKYTKAPSYICIPYTLNVKKLNIKRENSALYVGRLDPEKKIQRAIEFVLQCQYLKKFYIIGDGILKNKIKNLSRKHEKLIYLGQQNKKEIEMFYNKCKFFIHFPDYEPYGCAVIEAAKCGCIPLITKEVGASFLFNKIFIINNPDNFKEINKKIKELSENNKIIQNLLKRTVKKTPTEKESIKNFKRVFSQITKLTK